MKGSGQNGLGSIKRRERRIYGNAGERNGDRGREETLGGKGYELEELND